MVELAERRVEMERDASVAHIQAVLAAGVGSLICVDCEGEISEARRQAVPNARRCIDCETFIERQRRRHA